jgi:hypothetical protein
LSDQPFAGQAAVVWLVLGLAIYLYYGQRHSLVGKRLSSLIPAFDFGSPTA